MVSIAQLAFHILRTVEQVDATMDSIKEQMAVAAEISTAISGPITTDAIDEDDLQDELNELEQEVLDDRLRGAERVPVHTPATPTKERARTNLYPLIHPYDP